MKIVWTEFAINNLKSIFNYYKLNVSINVAQKIRNQILKSIIQLQNNPKSGQIEFYLEELNQNHRYLISGKYKIIYRIEKNFIIINDVFDGRQNPNKMMKKRSNK